MNKSETIGALAAALSKAQGEMGHASKDATNPHFRSKYADLAAVVEAMRGPLSANGLAYSQLCDFTESGGLVVETVLMHSSGEWISGKLQMPLAKNDPQGVGSGLTYAKRYSLAAIVGLAADEDDDGEGAMGRTAQPAKGPVQGPRKVNDAQRAKLFAEMGDGIPKAEQKAWMEKLSAELKAHFKVESSNDLPAAKFDSVLEWVREQKAKRAGLPE